MHIFILYFDLECIFQLWFNWITIFYKDGLLWNSAWTNTLTTIKSHGAKISFQYGRLVGYQMWRDVVPSVLFTVLGLDPTIHCVITIWRPLWQAYIFLCVDIWSRTTEPQIILFFWSFKRCRMCGLLNCTHTHTHTHTDMYVCVCVCVTLG